MEAHHPDTVASLLRVAACLLLVAAAAVGRNGRLLGKSVERQTAPDAGANAAVHLLDDGSVVVNSTSLAPDVSGYGGPVPVVVTLREGRVAQVQPVLPNDETPLFFGTLEEAGFWRAWDGLTASVAVTARVDAVTGATYSSRAALANVRAALAAAQSHAPAPSPSHPEAKTIAALAVLLAAAVLPLFIKSRRYRATQLALDILVLGLWNGLFLSHARLVGWAGAGLPGNTPDALAAALLLARAFLYPLFGRREHYCLHVCPFGAAQELAGRIPARKWRIPPRLVRALTAFRRLLWGVLMLALLTGLSASWLNWELFAAFAWRAAPPLLLALAAVFLVLAVFVPRPYCRFACPTGTLLKLAEANRKEQ